MGNYEQLKQAVSDVIKTNGNQEITGAILQNVLNTIISTVGANAQYTGVATPATTPGTPDQNVYYLAAVPGTYPNFGNIVVNPGEIAIISNTASGWSKTSTGIASDMMQILVGIRYMDSPTRYKPTRTSGEGLHGGVANVDDMEIVIPSGQTGISTYVQFVYGNSKTNGFNDAIANGTPFKVLHKFQLGDDAATTVPSFLNLESLGTGWTLSRRIVCTYKIGQYFYRLEEVTPTSQGTDQKNYLRTYMQISDTTGGVGFSAKYINSAVWISDERLELKIETDELNALLGQLDYVSNVDAVEKPITAVDLYEHMEIHSNRGTVIKSNGQTLVTFSPNTNMLGTYYRHRIGINGLGDVQVGDKIVMRDVVRVQRGTNTFTFEQLYSAAYMRINYTPKSGTVPVYFFRDGGTISAKLTKTAETDKYEFYEVIATITLNATQIAAIYSGTITNMEITIMNDTQLTLTDYFNIGILSTYVGKIGTNAKWITDIRNKEKRTEDELALIKSAIGMPYNTNYTDALVALSSTLTTGTYRANGYTVAAGTSEKGNTIDLLLDWNRFFGKTPTEGTFDIFMNYNGTGEETFVIEAFDEKYNKLGDGTYWHDYNNNYIRVNFPIRGFRDMPRIIIRVGVSSELANGYTMYYDHTVILGYGLLSPINARLLALEGMERPNIVTSPSGKKFQITVTDDGVLGTQSFYFSKMLVITHSYGLHRRSDSLGWFPTEPWGMAASAKEKDYPHRLLAKMQTVNPEAEISHIVNVATFERNHNEPGFNFSDYDYLNAYDFDVIVIKIGENAESNYPNMAAHLIELIDNHVGKNKNFKLFIASMFAYSSDTWDSQPVGMNNEFAKVATHYGTRLVMINKNGGSYGNQYTAANPVNLLPPKDDGTQPDKNTEVNAGVLRHPGDTGMEMIASEFWTEVKRIYQLTE